MLGLQIWQVHLHWRKCSMGVSRDCPIFCVPPIISGTGKATYFKFWRNIHRVDTTNYGTFAPKNFHSREWKYHGMELSLPGTFFPWNFRSWERKFQELSFPGTFAPWNFRSRGKIPRTFAPTPSDFRSRHSFMDMYRMHTRSRQSFNFCCTKA